MRSFVFTDEALRRQAGRFVWLAIDTEKAKNASFQTKYVVEAWPTFYVVDPSTESPLLRWMGGATTEQLQKILDDGRSALSRKGNALSSELARADALYGAGKNAEAAQAYRAVLAKAPRRWSAYGRATESLLFSLQMTHDNLSCAELANASFGILKKTPSSANVAASGLSCALEIPVGNSRRAPLVTALVADAREVLTDTSTKIAADDRSSVYQALAEERAQAKDEAGKNEFVSAWARFLEQEAARANSAEGRAVFDSHRLSAYLEMGTPEKAVAMLEGSERDLPDDYNPPARLALALKASKRYDEALAASDRALTKAYGPRRLGVLRTRADIYTAKGDLPATKKTLAQAVAEAEAMPKGQVPDGTIAGLKKKIAAMP